MTAVLTSEEQFQELLAHLIARANKALSQQEQIPPISLLLKHHGDVEVFVGVADSPRELRQVLNTMQVSLQERVKTGNILATCVAYSEPATDTVIALLENHENFCATVKLPVVHDPHRALDTVNMQVENGSIHVFPLT